MFLTTNRVETIDHAFESRIHLTLSYSELNVESRRKVWTNFIQSLQVDKSAITDDVIESLAKVDLNGRQIKNVAKMAGLLAAHSGGILEPEHVHTVLRIGKAY
jgi:ATP-dependent 26S proteasome regulatory subunit